MSDNPKIARVRRSRKTTVGTAAEESIHAEVKGQQLTLPVHSSDIFGYSNEPYTKKVLEVFGVKFGKVVEGDPLYQYVTLPPGWKKVPKVDYIINWMSYLLDEKGRKRVLIFDRVSGGHESASYYVMHRYDMYTDFSRQREDGGGIMSQVRDGDTVLYEAPILGDIKGSQISDRSRAIALPWLDAHFPDWKNPAAYWA